ncbi:unnamed protein product, partial [Protopolystoma xenopodis]
ERPFENPPKPIVPSANRLCWRDGSEPANQPSALARLAYDSLGVCGEHVTEASRLRPRCEHNATIALGLSMSVCVCDLDADADAFAKCPSAASFSHPLSPANRRAGGVAARRGVASSHRVCLQPSTGGPFTRFDVACPRPCVGPASPAISPPIGLRLRAHGQTPRSPAASQFSSAYRSIASAGIRRLNQGPNSPR